MRDAEQTYTIKELLSAIQENRNIAEIKQIISGIEDINQADYRGKTVLYWAVARGRTELVAQLLAAGADVNQANNDGKTALHEAAFNGHVEVVGQLLAAGADVNQARADGMTPLCWAVLKGHVEIVSQLLAAGVDVNQANNYGKTPLHVAAYKGHVEIVSQLLAAGVDVNQANNYGKTPLHVAAYKGHVEIVAQLLAAGADVNQASADGMTALYNAALFGHTEIVAQLLAAGADETLLTEAQQTQYAEAIAEGKAILIRNTRNSAIALAGTGRELQRVSIIQNHPSREQDEIQEHENKLPKLPKCILAQIAAFGTELPSPNSLTQKQIEQCANVGTESLESTGMRGFFHYETKFVQRDPKNTIENILNGNQNPNGGEVNRG
jgi:ankyrin repeat protein